ncbi:MAG: Gfo/Idh/MocA family oxidoreductase, partial [bacterium]|nr:Gfo/Idh/MocA family oxidoreductase [bacterium]
DVYKRQVCDRERSHAEALAGRLGLGASGVYTQVSRLLREQMPEALYVCTPPHAHEEAVFAAVERGVHLFIEKPIALKVEVGERMVEAVRRAGVVTQVGYHMRYGKAVRRLARLIKEGTAGRAVLFDGRYECNALHGAWWRDKRKSGGQVLEQAIHLYDLGMHLFGAVERVSGFVGNICHRETPGYSVEDVSAAVLRFRNGALGTIAATNCAIPMEWNNPFTVVCEWVTAKFRSAQEAEFTHTGERRRLVEHVKGEGDLYEAETREFLKRVRGEGGEGPELGEGLMGLRTVVSVLTSARRGGVPVKVKCEESVGKT